MDTRTSERFDVRRKGFAQQLWQHIEITTDIYCAKSVGLVLFNRLKYQHIFKTRAYMSPFAQTACISCDHSAPSSSLPQAARPSCTGSSLPHTWASTFQRRRPAEPRRRHDATSLLRQRSCLPCIRRFPIKKAARCRTALELTHYGNPYGYMVFKSQSL